MLATNAGSLGVYDQYRVKGLNREHELGFINKLMEHDLEYFYAFYVARLSNWHAILRGKVDEESCPMMSDDQEYEGQSSQLYV